MACSSSASAWAQALLGVTACAAVFQVVRSGFTEDDVAPASAPAVRIDLGQFPALVGDPSLTSTVTDLSEAFMTVDPESTQALLQNLNDLSACHFSVTKRPLQLHRALSARRGANKALKQLEALLRGKAPLQLSELDEDLKALRKIMEDYVHNTNLATSLSALEAF